MKTAIIGLGNIGKQVALNLIAGGQNLIVADAHNGKPLWHFNLGQVPHASPMSYGINGKQYFAIAAGSDVFVFGL